MSDADVESVGDMSDEAMETDSEETEETPMALTCCLLDNGVRCLNPIGDGMFVYRCERIENILNISYFDGSGHNYLCEKHRAAAFAVMMEDDFDFPLPQAFFCENFSINYESIPRNTIRRFLESRCMRVQLDSTKDQMFYSVSNFVQRRRDEKKFFSPPSWYHSSAFARSPQPTESSEEDTQESEEELLIKIVFQDPGNKEDDMTEDEFIENNSEYDSAECETENSADEIYNQEHRWSSIESFEESSNGFLSFSPGTKFVEKNHKTIYQSPDLELAIDHTERRISNSDSSIVIHDVNVALADDTDQDANYFLVLSDSDIKPFLSQYGLRLLAEIPLSSDFSTAEASDDMSTSSEEMNLNLQCCLNEKGVRCTRDIGEGMYSVRPHIEEMMEINFCSGAGHNYICDHHKDAINAAVMDSDVAFLLHSDEDSSDFLSF